MKKGGKILLWIVGVLFVIGGIGSLLDTPLFGIACVLFGISLMPKIWEVLGGQISGKKWIRVGIPVILFIICGMTAPAAQGRTVSQESVQKEEVALEEEQQKLSTPEPTVEATSIPEATETPEPTEIPTSEPTPTESPTPEPTPETVGDMAVHFLDVGQGLSVFVQSGGQNLIYDGGDRATSSFVVSYLQKQGVEKLDYIISSHYDSDHVYGLIGCINAFDVDTLICSDYDHDTDTYDSFVNAVSSKGLEMQHPAVGTVYNFGTGSFVILAPDSVSASDSNNNSVAIKLTNGDNSFIFVGDAEADSEAAMCSSGTDLDCDVLVPSHHGSATGTSWDFLQATVPEYAVISCGEGNQYGHPDKDTMDKLESMDIQVFRTDKQGTIVAVSDGTDIEWNQDPCNDYSPGDQSDSGTQPQSQSTGEESSDQSEETPNANQTVESTPAQEEQVWISATGSKYHNKPDCGNMNPDKATQMSRSEAESKNYEACKKCY